MLDGWVGPLYCAGEISQGGTVKQNCTHVSQGLEDQPAYSIQTGKVTSTAILPKKIQNSRFTNGRFESSSLLGFIAGESQVNAEIRAREEQGHNGTNKTVMGNVG